MNDLFEDKCPCCQRPYEGKVSVYGFAEFWELVPHKIGKADAQAAWKRMKTPDRNDAARLIGAFYAWFAKTYPTASPLHPATYLNRKRWLDDAIQDTARPATSTDIDAIKAGLSSRVPSVREHAQRMADRIGMKWETAQ